jgi:hypothetical protein
MMSIFLHVRDLMKNAEEMHELEVYVLESRVILPCHARLPCRSLVCLIFQ